LLMGNIKKGDFVTIDEKEGELTVHSGAMQK
jgi:hypothetical protein